jgi:hypothetical protein
MTSTRTDITTTTQEESVKEIKEKLDAVELTKRNLVELMKKTQNKIHTNYLKENIVGFNTEIRILLNMQTALNKTIRQLQKKKHRERMMNLRRY